MPKVPPKSNVLQYDLFGFDDDWLVSSVPATTHDKPDVSKLESTPEQARFNLAKVLASRLSTDGEISSKILTEEANYAFGGSQAEGKYSSKDAYDALEAGVNIYLVDTESAKFAQLSAQQAREKILSLSELIKKLPTQTRRDDEMDEFQQFSSPPPHSFLVNWVANIKPDDVVIEPSAGTGDLAVWAKIAGANIVLNELSARRSELLTSLFPDALVFKENAEQLDNLLPASVKPSVVLMNPPFSSTAGRVQGQRDTSNGARHIEQALRRLEEGGRLVAIVGKGMAADREQFAQWWKEIQRSYNVRANIGISGREYAKYGTAFDNQILVIDKDGATTNRILTGFVESVAELPDLLESIKNDRKQIGYYCPTPRKGKIGFIFYSGSSSSSSCIERRQKSGLL